VVHSELDLIARSLDRINALTKTLVTQMNNETLVSCTTLLQAGSSRVEEAASRHGKSVSVETKANDVRLDQEVLKAFEPVFCQMLEALVEYCIESPKERAARGKRPKAYFQFDIKPTEDGYRLMILCDGNGLIPPLAYDHGIRLAKIGARAAFEGKPGVWSAWFFHLPAGFGAFRGVVVKAAGRRLCIPASAVTRAGASSTIQTSGMIWALEDSISRVETEKSGGHGKEIVEISAGTHVVRYAFEAVNSPDEVFMKPLRDLYTGNGRFLGVVVDQNDPSELCLVLNPAYLVYGEEALNGS
jgi:hypothetical protein